MLVIHNRILYLPQSMSSGTLSTRHSPVCTLLCWQSPVALLCSRPDSPHTAHILDCWVGMQSWRGMPLLLWQLNVISIHQRLRPSHMHPLYEHWNSSWPLYSILWKRHQKLKEIIHQIRQLVDTVNLKHAHMVLLWGFSVLEHLRTV